MRHILFAGKESEPFKSAWATYGIELHRMVFDSVLNIDINLDKVKEMAENTSSEAIFSFDFEPMIAEICKQLKFIYISWIWDSPHTALWHKSARYENVYLFVFDYQQYINLINRGFTNAYYLPLAADIDAFDAVINNASAQEKEKYKSDVSFVGNLYNAGEQALFDRIKYLPEYTKGYLDSIINMQRNLWGVDLLSNSIDDRCWSELEKYVALDIGEDYESGVYEAYIYDLLGKKIAQIDRREMCNNLANRFDFRLYTGSSTEYNPQVINCGYASYLEEMPLIFHNSKININITIRSIPSGIPLRVLDVLACGGFLLTNYQPEIAEWFVEGEELVVYSDLDDMYKKIEYYLSHEEERKAIAQAGKRKIQSIFNYPYKIKEMLDVLNWEREG